MQSQTITVRTARIDRHPGASRGPQASPSPFPEIHDTAARQDGIVKLIVGLVFIVFSLGFAAVGVLALHALLRHQEFKIWAFIVGLPGAAMAAFGLVLMAWGAVKLGSGRGDG